MRKRFATYICALLTVAGAAMAQSADDRARVTADIEAAASALRAAEAVGAPIYAPEIYNDAMSRLTVARQNRDDRKDSVRDDARLKAVEARAAARAAEAKARLVGANTEVRNLQADISGFGGTAPSVMMYDETNDAMYRGTDSRDRVEIAEMAIVRAKAVNAQLLLPDEIKQAEDFVGTARKIAKSDRNNKSADHLAYISEMTARRAEYIARRNEIDRLLPSVRLERTRLAQAATERQAREEQQRREAAEKEALELRARLEAEAMNRRMQEEEVARLRAQVEANQQLIRSRLETDREARIEAERRLDQLIAEYESAIGAGSPEVERLRRQVEDQQLALRSLQEREVASEESFRSEVERLRKQLEDERSSGRSTADVLAQREEMLTRQTQELQELRQQREVANRRRAELDQQQRESIARAEEARRAAQAEAEQLRAQVAQAQTELATARQEIARRDADIQRQREEMQRALAAIADTRSDERGFVVTLPGIFFATGKSALTSGARNTLSKIAQQLTGDYRISIEGHTDSVGSDAMNQSLSEARANAVRDFLVARGVAAARITTSGRGESTPVAPNETAAGRQQNRRVELIIAN
jgi:outer membrane protein OmpA-like peptidoglycan-associated protein